MVSKRRSGALAAVMETARGLHKAGVLNGRAMQRFTALCDLKVPLKKRKHTPRGRVC